MYQQKFNAFQGAQEGICESLNLATAQLFRLKHQIARLRKLQINKISILRDIGLLTNKIQSLNSIKLTGQFHHSSVLDLDSQILNSLNNLVNQLSNKLVETGKDNDEELQKEIKCFKAQIQTLQNKLRQLERQAQDISRQNSTFFSDNQSLLVRINSLKQEIIILNAQIQELSGLLASSLSELRGIELSIRQAEGQNQKVKSHLKLAQQQNKRIKSNLQGRKDQSKPLQILLQDLQFKLADMAGLNAALQKEIQNSNSQIEAILKNLNIQRQTGRNLSQQMLQLQTAIKKRQDQYSTKKAKISGNQQIIKKLKAKIQGLKCQINVCQNAIIQSQSMNKNIINQIENSIRSSQLVDSLLNRKEILKTVLQPLEGYQAQARLHHRGQRNFIDFGRS